jgi:AmiR/NasT family two-component response regulator
VREASKRGVFAHITDDDEHWQSSIDIALRRFAEFAMLRDHARANNRKLIDIANAIVDGHRLLPGT